MNITDAYMFVIWVSLLGGGIYGLYVGLKNAHNPMGVAVSCIIGIGFGELFGILSPVIIPGYLIKKISDTIE